MNPFRISVGLFFLSCVFALGVSAAPMGVPQTDSKTTSCCWCVSRWTEESEVWVYSGKTGCEARSGTTTYRSCQQVQVEGEACSFVKVSRFSRDIRCSVHPLYYAEKGERKQIPTPDFTTCQTRQMANFPGGLGVSPEPAGPQTAARSDGGAESICRCGLDPSNPSQCVAVKTVNGRTFRDLASLAPGETNCDNPCRVLLSGSETFRDCTHFEH